MDAALPAGIPKQMPHSLPPPISEAEVLTELRSIAELNETWTTLIGMGYHGCFTPPVLLRDVENPGRAHCLYAVSARDQPRQA